MRFVLRWTFRLVIFAIVVAMAVVLLRGVIAKSILEQQLRAATGLEVQIGSVELSLSAPSVTLRDVRLTDTAEFGGIRMADIAEIHAVYDRGAIRSRQLRFQLLRLDIRELHLVESLQGKLNLGRFAVASGPAATQTKAAWRWVGADVFNLSIDRLRYTSLKRPEASQQVTLGMANEVLLKVESAKVIADAVLSRLLQKGITLGLAPTKTVAP